MFERLLSARPPAAASDVSAYGRRLPVVVLALLGAAISTYLTLYQWHVTHDVWDPVFGPASSAAVLTSFISRALPVPDATLGAAGYVVEAALGVVGGPDRWRRSPRLVLTYGAVVAVLAITAALLVLVQAALLHAGCALCLASAAISFINAGLARDEVTASLAFGRGAGAPHRIP